MPRLLQWIIPTEQVFYEMLRAQSTNTLCGAQGLNELVACEDAGAAERLLQKISEAERAGDESRRVMTAELNKSLITPIDREDLFELSRQLDYVLDGMEATAQGIKIYGGARHQGLSKISRLLLDAVTEVDSATRSLHKGRGDIIKNCERIHSLGHEAGAARREYIAELLRTQDAATIVAHKELADSLESAVRRCTIIADIAERILVKHG